MSRDHSNVDTNSIISIIKGTIRGKIAVGCVIIAIISGFSDDDMHLTRMIIWLLFAALFIGNAKKSIDKKRAADERSKTETALTAAKSSATKCVGDYLYVNENDQTWCAPSVSPRQYSFSELLDYSVVENGDDVVGGSLLGTAVGAMGGGLTGALLGATASKVSSVCSDLGIKISVNDIDTPIIYISLINSEVNKKWDQYKKAAANAEEIAGVLAVIKARNKN